MHGTIMVFFVLTAVKFYSLFERYNGPSESRATLGKGQSIIKNESEIEKAWDEALQGSRGDLMEVIVEEFISFDYEITLLTLTQNNNNTLFCPPIGHRQERGDYQESWQPMKMEDSHLKTAQEMADKVTKSLGGSGIWGVEFFIGKDGVYFSSIKFTKVVPNNTWF